MPIDLNEHFKKKNSSGNGGGGGSGGGGGGNIEPPLKPPEFLKNLGKKAGILYGVLIILVLLFLAKPYSIINSGEVGIMVTAGKYDTVPLQPGIHFHIPVLQKIIVVDTKVRIINYRGGQPSGMGQAREGIIANDQITVLDRRIGGYVLSPPGNHFFGPVFWKPETDRSGAP